MSDNSEGLAEGDDLTPDELLEVIRRNSHLLPAHRKPNILICGETGAGKTTTINTTFGTEVGRIGYFSRGTDVDALYEWEAQGQYIDIVDLPGLGDSYENDTKYVEIYRQRIENADGFLIVVRPPRALSRATIETVNLLLDCSVHPERIIFAYNCLTDIYAPIAGQHRRVRLNGIAGPASADDQAVIDEARKLFHTGLQDNLSGGERFPYRNIVPFDAISGWNLFEVYDALLATLPGDALVPWREAVKAAAFELQRRAEEEEEERQAYINREIERVRAADEERRQEKEIRELERLRAADDQRQKATEHELERIRKAASESASELQHLRSQLIESRERFVAAQETAISLKKHGKSVEEKYAEYIIKALKIARATYSTIKAVAKIVRKIFP